LALGRFPEELLHVLQQGFNIDFVFTDILYHDIRAYQLPFLQGRALWFASQFASGLPLELRVSYFENCVDFLQTTAGVEVKIMATKAIGAFLITVGKENAMKQQSKCLEGVIKLLPVAKEDVLVLVLETLLMVIGVDLEGLVNYEQVVSEGLLEIWNLNFRGIMY
jgi:intracellular sulfur oxidation DsrE/DsrF family protein